MGADFGKAFGDAFRYSFSLKRMLPFFVMGLIIVFVLFMSAQRAINILPETMSMTNSTLAIFSIVQIVLIVLLVFIIVALAYLYFEGAVTDNAKKYTQGKERPLAESYNIASKKYMSMFGASLLTMLIVTGLSMIPIAGIVLGIIFSWFFLFVIQIIIVSDERAIESLEKGYRLFLSNKLDVFLFWLILSILTVIITFVAFIPLVIAALPAMGAIITAMIQGSSLTGMLYILKKHLYTLVIGGIITAFIFSYLMVFEISAKTFFYNQLVKKPKDKKNK